MIIQSLTKNRYNILLPTMDILKLKMITETIAEFPPAL